jgi:formylglycine-generating enzyme required for sulfatase activity
VWFLAVTRSLAQDTATAVASVTAGYVTSINLTAPGSGYLEPPRVTISGGGGTGAEGKAILEGDKVALVIVLSAGSGYSSAPSVTIADPPKTLGLQLELIPRITVQGLAGSLARVEWALNPTGPWTVLSNVLVTADGAVLLDLQPGDSRRFYRARGTPKQLGTDGFVWIPPGTFVRGSPTDEPGRKTDETMYLDETMHTVTLTKGFWMCDHEVTQAEYEAVLAGYFRPESTTPSTFKGLDLPVENIPKDQTFAYCNLLTRREHAAGRISPQQLYRLPTESEWEYAARAGATWARHGELDAVAWWSGNSGSQTHPVKSKQPNAWGLYDMLGNVAEWCSTKPGAYPTGSVTDPTGEQYGGSYIVRGGSWTQDANFSRLASRDSNAVGRGSSSLGFRVVLDAAP